MFTNDKLKIVNSAAGLGLAAKAPLYEDEVVLDGCPPKSSIGMVIMSGTEAEGVLSGAPEIKSRVLQVGASAWWGTEDEENLYVRQLANRRISEEPTDPRHRLARAWTYLVESAQCPDDEGVWRSAEIALADIDMVAAAFGDTGAVRQLRAMYFNSVGALEQALETCLSGGASDTPVFLQMQAADILNTLGQHDKARQITGRSITDHSPPWHHFIDAVACLHGRDYIGARSGFRASLAPVSYHQMDAATFFSMTFDATSWGYTDYVNQRHAGIRNRFKDSFLSRSRVLLDANAYLAICETMAGNTEAASAHLRFVDKCNPNDLSLISWQARNRAMYPAGRDFICEALTSAGVRTGRYLPRQRYLNHSCSPNVYFDADFRFRALRRIASGEMLAFDYTTTEAQIVPFHCACKAPDCLGRISGFAALNEIEKKKRYAHLAPHLKRMFPPPQVSGPQSEMQLKEKPV